MMAAPKDRGLHNVLSDLTAEAIEPYKPAQRDLVVPAQPEPTPEEEGIDEVAELEREAEARAAQRPKKRKLPEHRTGTRKHPYPRLDTQLMVKVGLTFTQGFDQAFRQFAATLPPGVTKSAWAEKVLKRALEAQKRRTDKER